MLNRSFISCLALAVLASPAACGGDVKPLGPGDEAGAEDASDSADEASDSDGNGSSDAHSETSTMVAAPDVGLPSCCSRIATNDPQCTSLAEPPHAYVCDCDGGNINPACTINPPTELVCCP